jgi:hypothetical protein
MSKNRYENRKRSGALGGAAGKKRTEPACVSATSPVLSRRELQEIVTAVLG